MEETIMLPCSFCEDFMVLDQNKEEVSGCILSFKSVEDVEVILCENCMKLMQNVSSDTRDKIIEAVKKAPKDASISELVKSFLVQ